VASLAIHMVQLSRDTRFSVDCAHRSGATSVGVLGQQAITGSRTHGIARGLKQNRRASDQNVGVRQKLFLVGWIFANQEEQRVAAPVPLQAAKVR